MQLRPHQETALILARQSIKNGNKRPIIAAPTSFGKTILAGKMLKNCQDMGKRGWFFCDRIQLIEQSIDKFREMGIDFGVRQAEHELMNAQAPIQIASIATISAMVKKHNGRLPEFDMALVDECHTQYEIIKDIIKQYDNIPIIGLTATPYSNGLGKLYNDLIVPITPRELLDGGYLCPVRYYGGAHVDLKKVASIDANTYKTSDLERETDKNKEMLTGSIIENWFTYANNQQTIAFSPSQNHSKYLVEKFNKAGVTAEHIDCYTTQEERQDLFEAHNNGEFKILSCSRLLNTGYDAPSVRCIIDCFPAKSVTVYVQRVGRIMRTFEGKDEAIYLDHAGNFSQFGYAEDIVPEELHDGEKPHREQDLTKKKEKKDAKVRECPQCFQQMQGMRCMSCGYSVPVGEQMEDDGSLLVELQEGKKANRNTSVEDKARFLSELHLIKNQRGYSEGWCSYKYRERFGVWPNKITPYHTESISEDTSNWIKHSNIKKAKANAKASSGARR
jgi:superfamily II DNA or RNA helicase